MTSFLCLINRHLEISYMAEVGEASNSCVRESLRLPRHVPLMLPDCRAADVSMLKLVGSFDKHGRACPCSARPH